MEIKDQQTEPEASDMEYVIDAPEAGAEHETAAADGDLDEAAASQAEGDTSLDEEEHAPLTIEEALAQEQQKAAEYLDHLQRLQADFQNYRRRMTQEKTHAASRGKEDLLQALLPILANLGLAVQHAEGDANAVRQGVQMIWQQFEGFLRDQGVERITTVGEPFDPARHDVLSTIPATDDAPADTIVQEVKAGYFFDGRLLCPAQVIVTKTVAPSVEAAPSDEVSTEKASAS